ncbi:hypothetical protein O9H85_27885 [Paenibacillus filicis]|uniref:Uncharacterized protein n=1 Tax=Paenibacillus gyeongsangnamensis TaxID=3388067 RepID=A0ABT4QGZ1_9BACL|nr:hypothetical protein [Paenibacillus filicis]MCZ8516151.1 hypothetical protein [Paenibacillus filicis]
MKEKGACRGKLLRRFVWTCSSNMVILFICPENVSFRFRQTLPAAAIHVMLFIQNICLIVYITTKKTLEKGR